MSDTPAFDAFWAASATNPTTRPPWSRSVGAWVDSPDAPNPLAMAIDVKLPRPRRNRTLRALDARMSTRNIAATPIALPQVASVLAAVGATPDGRRRVASAGALYPVEVLVMPWAVVGLDASVHRYDPNAHGLSRLDPLPDPETIADLLDPGEPPGGAGAIVLAVHLDTTLAKYGERGGRFALIEVGLAAANLTHAATALGLSSCLLGGTDDRRLADLINGDRSPRLKVASALVLGA